MTFRKRQETTRPFDRMLRTTCGNCPTGCGLKVYLAGGKVADILGDEEHPASKGSVCPKGLLSLFHLGNPARLARPRIREDASLPFRTVGWDEAVRFIAGRLGRCLEQHGRESVAIHAAETDPLDYLAGGALFARLLGSPMGPGRFLPGPFGAGGAVARMFGVPAGQLQSNSPRDWCNSRCIVLYACDLAATDPIALGPVLDARDRGARILAIGSTHDVTAAKATFAVRVRPGSESVFLQGVLRQLIQDGRLDRDFLAEWTEGLDQLKAVVEPWTPQAVARACDVSKEDLAQFAAQAAATGPLQVIAGDWFSRRRLSDADLWACAALVCLTGSLGKPGGGLNLFAVSPFLFGSGPGQPDRDLDLSRLLADGKPELSALFCCGDLALAGDDPGRALARASLVVNLSQYPNRTAEAAHVSLPLSSWLEYDGLLACSNGRAVQRHCKAVDAPGECRPALDFWRDLARAAGLPGTADWGRDGDPAGFYDALLEQNPITRGMRFADLDPGSNLPGGVLWPCPDRSGLELETTRYISGTTRGTNILFQRIGTYPGTDRRFPTPSGRISLAGVPAAAPAPVRDPAHALRLVTAARVDRVPAWGDQVADAPAARVEYAHINPRLGKALDVADGEDLVVASPRGSLRLPVRWSDDVAPGVVRLPAGAGSGDPGRPDPAALFAIPDAGNTLAPFAWVTAHRAGGDPEAARHSIAGLLETLDNSADAPERQG